MTRKKKYVQIAGLLFCLLCGLLLILYHSGLANEDTEGIFHDDSIIPEGSEEVYDPLSDIKYIPDSHNDSKAPSYDYGESVKNYPANTYLRDYGYTLTSKAYDSADTKLALVMSELSFPAEYSLAEYKAEKPVVTEGKKGGTYTEYEKVTEACPVLRPYYGYIIYTAADSVKLLDSNCKVLISDFKGYTPAYITNSNGDPLFEKGGRYYFYYDGKTEYTGVYENITGEGYNEKYTTTPTAYQYFSFDTDLLLNYYASNFTDDSYYFTEVISELPSKAGMAEYTVDSKVHNELRVPVQDYGKGNTGLYPFYTVRYSKTVTNPEEVESGAKPRYTFDIEGIFWGYMDKDGNTVVEPQYKAAYDFSDNGYAVVLNLDDQLCVIDKTGKLVYNAYKNIYYFAELGDKKIRDGFYMPDTLGIENLGMFTFDHGYLRARRQLVDTANGYIIKRETQVLSDIQGRTLNYPEDCTLISYSDGMLLLEMNGLYGYMNHLGEWVIEPKLVYAEPFCEGLAVIAYSTKQLGVIDTAGNIVMPTVYQYIENCSGGVITAYHHTGGWTVYNKMTVAEKQEEKTPDPRLLLKERSIAQAKYEFYIKDTEVE